MTSATEKLRRLLDERGVEYDTDDEDGCEFTEWVANGLEWEADSRGELVSLMPVMLITPEQAIAATLGSCNCTNDCTNSERTETCHDSNKRFNAWQCSECGATLLLMFDDYDEPTYSVDGVADVPRFCPNCGKRVVEPTTNDVDAEVDA